MSSLEKTIEKIQREPRVALEEGLMPHSAALSTLVGACHQVVEEISALSPENADETADKLQRMGDSLMARRQELPDGETLRDALGQLLHLHASLASKAAADLEAMR